MVEQQQERSKVAAQMEAAMASGGYDTIDLPPRPSMKKIDLIPRIGGGTPAPTTSEKQRLKTVRSVDQDPIEGARKKQEEADMWASEIVIHPALSSGSSLSWHTFKENKENPFSDNGEVTEEEKAAAIQAVADQAVKDVAVTAEEEEKGTDFAVDVWGEPPTFDENKDGIERNRSIMSYRTTKTEEMIEKAEEDLAVDEHKDVVTTEHLVIIAPVPSDNPAPEEAAGEPTFEENKEGKVRGGTAFADLNQEEAATNDDVTNSKSKKETTSGRAAAFGKISTASRMFKRRTRISNLRKKKNAAKSTSKAPASLPTVQEDGDATDVEQDTKTAKSTTIPQGILGASSSISGEGKKSRRGLGLRRRVRMLGGYRHSKRSSEPRKIATETMEHDEADTSKRESKILYEDEDQQPDDEMPSTPVKTKLADDESAASMANIVITPVKATEDKVEKEDGENPADTPTTTATNASTLDTLSPTQQDELNVDTDGDGEEGAPQFLPPVMPGSVLTEKANPEEAEALDAFLDGDKPSPPGSNSSCDAESPDPESSASDEGSGLSNDMDLFQIKSSYKLREELENLKETVHYSNETKKDETTLEDTCSVTSGKASEGSDANTEDPSVHILFPDDDQGVLIGTSNDVLVEVSSVTQGDTGGEDIEVIKCMGLEDIGRDILSASSRIRDIQDHNDEEDADEKEDSGEGSAGERQSNKSVSIKTEKSARTSKSMWTSKTDKTNKTTSSDKTSGNVPTQTSTKASQKPRGRLGKERFRAAASAMKIVGTGNREPGQSRSKSRARSKSIKRRLSRKNSIPNEEQQVAPNKRDESVKPDIPSDITVRSKRHGLSRAAKKEVKASEVNSCGSHPNEEFAPVIITPVSTPVLGQNQNKYGLSAEAQAALAGGDFEAIEVRGRAAGLSDKARDILREEKELESDLEEIEVSRGRSRMGGVGSVRGRASQNKIMVSKSQKNRRQARNIRRSGSEYSSFDSDDESYYSQDEYSDEYESESYESESYADDDRSYYDSDDCTSVSSRNGKERTDDFKQMQEEIMEDLMDAFQDTTAHIGQMFGIGIAREDGDYEYMVPETACGKRGASKRRTKARSARRAAEDWGASKQRSSPRRKGEKSSCSAKNGSRRSHGRFESVDDSERAGDRRKSKSVRRQRDGAERQPSSGVRRMQV